MSHFKKFISVISLATALVVVGCGPRNYEDCVLKNLKGSESSSAANAITQACRDKFYKEAEVSYEFKPLVDFDKKLKTEKELAGIELGDSLDTVIYKKGKGIEDKNDKKFIWYESDRVWIGFSSSENRVSVISHQCSNDDPYHSSSEISLNGVSCWASEADVKKRYYEKSKMICFKDNPEFRSIEVKDLNISFTLKQGVVSSFAVHSKPLIGEECVN